jgi:hypothetical protein
MEATFMMMVIFKMHNVTQCTVSMNSKLEACDFAYNVQVAKCPRNLSHPYDS